MGSSKTQNILLNSQVLNCCDGLSQSTNSARDSNDDNCNKIQPFECELQVGTSTEKKQDWSFTLYDFDGKGKITKEELGNLFQALYDAVGSSIRLPLNGTKKLKLRLSIGHDNSHLDTPFKDQSPPLVKKKAKLKTSSGLTEWKEINLQTGTGGGSGVGMVDPKECTKLNNLDASPRAKPSALSKMENQLTSATPGIGHRLMLSCREQRKLTEMVHENMVRNQVRQQTGRKHHHSGHRHHHHHREARRHRGTRRQGDENRKPRENERTYYLDLGVIERSAPHNSVSLPYSAGVPTTTGLTTATLTTSVMSFARPTIINIVPSSSPPPPPPPPPPPTASGSTAYCNEIGMAADDDDDGDDVVRPEAGGNGSRRKYDNTWRETGLEEPATGHGCLTTTTSGQQDHHHHHHHPHHHHHHHHRRRHHPHRNSGDGGHAKCKHCNEKCGPINIEAVKVSMNGATESENANKTEKKEILNRRHKHSNNCNTNVNYNNNNDNDNCNELNNNNNNNNNNSVKNIRDANRELELVSGGDMTKQDNPPSTYKCHNSDANLKASLDCICSRCQKMSCRVSVNYTGSWQAKSENLHDLQQRNAIASADGQETTAGINTLTSAATNTTTTTTTAAAVSSQCEKKTSDRSSKRTGEERHKKHSQGHHHAHIGRTLSQDRGGQSGPAVAAPVPSSVSAVASKMTAPGRTPGAVAERKSLRTYHKTDSSPQQTSSRHRSHCQNTLVPEKHAGALPSALLPPPVSPPTPDPTPTTAVATTTSTTTATTATTTTTLQQQQPHHHHHHHHHLRRRNQTIRNMEFNETMQQVAEWINREHNPQQKEQAQSHQGSVNAEHFVHVQRHEHHHVHEYHHHHHYHHYYQT